MSVQSQVADVLGQHPDHIRDDDRLAELAVADRIVVTSITNNTNRFDPFWQSLATYRKETGAALMVKPVDYRNPTSPGETVLLERNKWWDDEVEPYLVRNDFDLHPLLRFFGAWPINATREDPLRGKDAVSHSASAIFGHSRLSMKTVATPQNSMAKILHTTGSVGVPHYSASDIGFKSKFHHVQSALIVEKANDLFHIRVLDACEDGSFIDLDREFSPDGVAPAGRALGLTLGDTHAWFSDLVVDEVTFGELIPLLRPREVHFNDLIDCYSISHWHRKNLATRIAKHKAGMYRIHDELDHAIQFAMARREAVGIHAPIDDCQFYIIPSNHHDHLQRWLNEVDIRTEPWNAGTYGELIQMLHDEGEMGPAGASAPHPFGWWADRHYPDHGLRFLKYTDPHMCGEVLILHGHLGPSGAKGNPKGHANIGPKTNTAHNHGPAIWQGNWRAGCSADPLEYNTDAPSGNLFSHVGILANGRRQAYHIINGEFRA